MGADPIHPLIPDLRYPERLARAQKLLPERGVSAMLVGVGADLRYLTGYQATPLERLTMLVMPAQGELKLVAPRLEAMAAAACPAARLGDLRVVAWDETDDTHGLVGSLLADALGRPAGARGGVAADDHVLISDRLWAMHVLGLQRAMPHVSFGLSSLVLSGLRMVKDQ